MQLCKSAAVSYARRIKPVLAIAGSLLVTAAVGALVLFALSPRRDARETRKHCRAQRDQGHIEEAARCFEQCAELSGEAQDHLSAAKMLLALGRCQDAKKQHDLAATLHAGGKSFAHVRFELEACLAADGGAPSHTHLH